MAGSNLGTLLLNIVTRSDTSGLNKTDNALHKTQNSIKSMSKDMGFLSKFAKGFLGYFSVREIGNALGSYLQLEKDIGAMKSRFFAVTGNEKQAAEEFEWIRKVATDTANDIKSTADSYSIFYSAVRKNMGEEATKEVFEDWTRVGRVLHLSQYQMERVTYALREMASKGAIYSQDLRMQIGTHVPNAMGLAQKAAEEMGIKGTDWFEQLQGKAKGSTKVTAEFVRRFSQQAKKMYGSETAFRKAMQQPDALANEIKNIGTNFMINFSKAGGSYMTVKILQSIANALLKIDYNKLANTLGSWAHKTGDFFNFMTSHIGTIIFLLKWIATAYVGGKVGSALQGAYGAAKFAFGRQLLGKTALGLAGAGMGGRLGLGLLAGSGGATFMRFIAGGLFMGGKRLLGGLIVRALGFFGGPWGLVASLIIGFLPNIVTWLGKIWAAYKGKNLTFDEYLASQGVTRDKLKTAMEEINKKKYGGTSLAQTEARRLLGNELGNKVMYNHGELVVNFNGNFITMDEIKQNIGLAVQQASGMNQAPFRSKTGSSLMYFQKFNEKERNYLI